MRHSESVCMRLQGRLGNQLFQLALALNLSHQFGVRVLLEDQVANSKGFERFLFKELAVFDNFQYCSKARSIAVRAMHHPAIRKLYRSKAIFIEGENDSHELNLMQPYHSYAGFFQSPSFFPPRDILLKAFSLKHEFIDGELLKLLQIAKQSNCLAVSVRRGDFLGLPHLGACSDDYYLQAIALIESRRTVDRIFVFSDDINYCREMFASLTCQTIYVEGFTPAKSLHLMSRCQHFVIANSTFSWWGAWLSDYQEKLVICPSPWNDQEAIASDFIPADWIELPKHPVLNYL